ncbi:MAG: hypothetical protein PF637_10000 [Spirochaetes bacterium]|jgi:hypothetical protein|nr:hypothetical protein [Spirochaetota bacterium]
MVLFAFVAVLSVVACDDSGSNDKDKDLEVKTQVYEFVDGQFKFYTNDKDNLNTWWYFTKANDTVGTLSEVVIEVTKNSGAKSYGSGMIFSYGKDTGDFFVFVINYTGYYSVQKYLDTTWASNIIDWSKTSSSKTTLGESNILKVTYDSSTENYSVFVNGNKVNEFTDNSITPTDTCGFFTYVAPEEEEDFPNYPVDVDYKMTSPYMLPGVK